MRTTVRLDDQLLTDAKEHAERTGRTLTALLEDALRAFLALENRPRRGRPRKLPTFGEGGRRQGIDLDDSAALQDVMDGHDRVKSPD